MTRTDRSRHALTYRRSSGRRALAALVAAAGLLAAPVLATPALAHDSLINVTPAPDSQVDSAPSEVVLTFSAEVLPTGTAARVADGDGNPVDAGDPELDGATVTIPLPDGLPDSAYSVTWRVVSSDGHPISGITNFTVGAASQGEEGGTTDPAAGQPTGDAVSDPAEGAATDPEGSDQDAGGSGTQEDAGTTTSDEGAGEAGDLASDGSDTAGTAEASDVGEQPVWVPVLIGVGVMALVAVGIIAVRRATRRPHPEDAPEA